MADWNEIRKEYETTKITLKALAEKYDIKIGTLKSRKSREGWSRDPTKKKDATQPKKVATPKKDATQKQAEQVIENENLNDNQKMFCLYYIKYFNATKAYQKAYRCSYEVANKNAYTLMVKHGIKSEIERLKKERAMGALLDAQAILQRYIDIAFADITDYMTFGQREVQVMGPFGPVKDEDGNVLMRTVNYVDFHESATVDGTIISEVKQGKDGVSVKLADKMKALDFLAKYTDLLSENDRKKLQREKMKMDIEKARAEAERITKDTNKESLVTIVDDIEDDE
jgi:phage terminase small subunit